jgi:hypothetical protein
MQDPWFFWSVILIEITILTMHQFGHLVKWDPRREMVVKMAMAQSN